MALGNYSKEQIQNIKATPQELDAWEALRREPGLMGRLARKGKHMKPNFVGGRRSFETEGEGDLSQDEEGNFGNFSGGGDSSVDSQQSGNQDFGHDVNYGTEDRGGYDGTGPTAQPQPQPDGGGGGETAAQREARLAREAAAAEAAAAAAAAAAEEKAKKEKLKTDRSKRRKGLVEGTMRDASGVEEGTEGVFTDSQNRVEGDDGFDPDDPAGTMVGAYDESTGELDTEGSLEGARTDYKDLREQADYTETREGYLTDASGRREGEDGFVAEGATRQGGLSQYQREADKLGKEAGTKFDDKTGYESQISKMADQSAAIGGETGLQSKVGDAAGKMGTMATDATDTQKLMEDRGLFAGQLETQRKSAQKGNLANLRRSMASAGSSPEEIARAESAARSGGAQQGRSDTLQASMSAMGAKQGQMAQAAGMLQGQAGMYGQQAGMLGQAQNLGLQKIGAQAGMYQQGLGAQAGMMNMGSNLANQQQMSMQNQIQQQAGLTGDMAGMTQAQLQDVVAQQNSAQTVDLAERGFGIQQQANAANAPQGPSQGQQLMNLAQTGIQAYGTYKMATAGGGGSCIPEGIVIDMSNGSQTPIEEINAGDFVLGMDGMETEVLQAHQYKQNPYAKFVTVTFDDGSKVDCSHDHMINDKRARDYTYHDKIGSREVIGIVFYMGVERSYDLLTATGGYRINGIPINTMIPEMAEKSLAEMNKIIKLAA
jgi:hypothetical protein